MVCNFSIGGRLILVVAPFWSMAHTTPEGERGYAEESKQTTSREQLEVGRKQLLQCSHEYYTMILIVYKDCVYFVSTCRNVKTEKKTHNFGNVCKSPSPASAPNNLASA